MNQDFKTEYEIVHKNEILEGIEKSLYENFDNYMFEVAYNQSKNTRQILDNIDHLILEHKRISWIDIK